jgi:hypothetical protein
MEFYLRPSVRVALVGDDLVILNLTDNAYYCLPGQGAVVSAGPSGRVLIRDPNLAAAMQNWLTHTQPSSPPELVVPLPRASAWRTAEEQVSATDLAMFGLAYMESASRYYCAPFGALVAHAAKQASSLAPQERMAASVRHLRLARVHDQLLPWAPLQGECFFRSFMLLNFLRLAGLGASWVFGVKTWPFQAHCWIQAGETVLDDACERVAQYTPIMSI